MAAPLNPPNMYYPEGAWKELKDLLKPHSIHFLINYTQKTVVFFSDEKLDKLLDSLNGEPVVVQRSPTYTIGESEVRDILEGGIMDTLITQIKLELFFSDSN